MVTKMVHTKLNEAADDGPKEEWAKYGAKIDDFINDTIKRAKDLYEEGQDLLQDKEDLGSMKDAKFIYVSNRSSFLKGLIGTLSQRFEGFKREG